ncbi:MAG: hypothetical protein KDK40_02085 [Chlamydiia bacterium]|nr:hypothetical protein [Chlamydiia bacterium]
MSKWILIDRKCLSPLLLVLSLCLWIGEGLSAREPYRVQLLVGVESALVDAPNLVDLKRDLTTAAIQELIPIYTPTTLLNLNIDLRGLNLIGSFAANSTTLNVEFPNLGISASFTGSTRDESWALFRDYIRDAGARSKLLKAYARYSPIDIIAGNPNSLMALMADADYLLSGYEQLGECHTSCGRAHCGVSQYQVKAGFLRGFSQGYDTSSFSLPLRYSFSPNRKIDLLWDLPITYNRNGGASSLAASMGSGIRYHVNDRWNLTSLLRLGVGGSLDLCTSGGFLSGGVNSAYDYPTGFGRLSIVNYVGYTHSIDLWLTGINFNYHIHEWIFKNGLIFETPDTFSLFHRNFRLSLIFTDTLFTGDKLYIEHYDEVGVRVTMNSCLNGRKRSCLAWGVNYQFGEKKYHGYSVNLLYQF